VSPPQQVELVDDPTDLILVGADKRKISEQWAFEDILPSSANSGAAKLPWAG
jgi:hypothetical protein